MYNRKADSFNRPGLVFNLKGITGKGDYDK